MKKQKLGLLLTSVIAAVSLTTAGAHAEMDMGNEGGGTALTVTADGKMIQGSVPPYWDGSMHDVMVPIRAVSEMTGHFVGWDPVHHAVMIDSLKPHAETEYTAPISIIVSEQVRDGIHPISVNGTVMVPAGELTKAIDAEEAWSSGNSLQITSHQSLKEFADEDEQVNDVFHGVGMKPHIAPDGAKEFTLVAEPHKWEPVKGVVADALAYNGQVPGPLIRVTEGEHVRITLVNHLSEPTTLHWHGLSVPNAMDGVPDITQKPVQPGDSFTYDFIAGPAGTHMYHSHYDDMAQVGGGLYGAFIIDPKDAGKEAGYNHEYTMLLSGFHINSKDNDEDFYTINGRNYPDTPPIQVKKGDTVRIRLINIDPTEIHTMHLHGMNFQVIAKDGQPVEHPQSMNTVMIGPGETYDIAFTASAVGTWMFHCHILDHTMNGNQMSGGEMGGLITAVKVSE
ncbi:multicopper oxidase domain-containing protein [Paenibacillus sp. P26]|nr:multicopper oxidase domain-containing protein [Paenibacillus sp. P26]